MEKKIIYAKLQMIVEFLNRWAESHLKNYLKSTPLLYREGYRYFSKVSKIIGSWDHCGLDQSGTFHRRGEIWSKFCSIRFEEVKRMRERVRERTGTKASISAWTCLRFEPNQLTIRIEPFFCTSQKKIDSKVIFKHT